MSDKKEVKTSESAPTNPHNADSESTGTTTEKKSYITNKMESWSFGVKGTYLSFFLLICGMVASIIAQNYYSSSTTSSSFLQDCPNGYDRSCLGNSAVYRFSFALVVIFVIQLLGTTIFVPFYDRYWIGKVLSFIAVVIGFFYADANVFDDNGYAWFARFAAFFYVILQQIIFIDFAYIVNTRFLSYAEEDGTNKWYIVIIVLSILLYSSSFSAIGVMYWQFLGCESNAVILSLTIILPILATVVQLFVSDNGSILTSGIMTAYATYICYSAVTLNPNPSCNPTISTDFQSVSVAIGLSLTVLSITWATYTAVSKIGENVKSLPTNGEVAGASADNAVGLRGVLQSTALVFILVSTYYAMVLTNWATLQSSTGSISNPRYGDIALWLQASAQWVAILLYIWTLIVPKLFPDREFSY